MANTIGNFKSIPCGNYGADAVFIESETGEPIATVRWNGDSARQKEITEHIVRCCNAHDALVAALDWLLNHPDEERGVDTAITNANKLLASAHGEPAPASAPPAKASKLKVFSGSAIYAGKQATTIVAATSRAKAVELLQAARIYVTVHDLATYWSSLGSQGERAIALAHPGQVFRASSTSGTDFKPFQG